MIHFDTNFLIAATVAGSSAHKESQNWSAHGEHFGVSTIARAEYFRGPLDAPARKIFPHPEGFPADDATFAAELLNRTGRRSRPLADCMIAAVAVRCSAKLATLNAQDFQPFTLHGLQLA
ncbi:MAG TPA: type II toxin-antitoxin system VapC family toxin [Verrucomicrobiae bacterium]|nr:type II toxin-antitoxin system VapC family toxin [Verrucomicrobiae bacterium]